MLYPIARSKINDLATHQPESFSSLDQNMRENTRSLIDEVSIARNYILLKPKWITKDSCPSTQGFCRVWGFLRWLIVVFKFAKLIKGHSSGFFNVPALIVNLGAISSIDWRMGADYIGLMEKQRLESPPLWGTFRNIQRLLLNRSSGRTVHSWRKRDFSSGIVVLLISDPSWIFTGHYCTKFYEEGPS